MAEPDHVNHEHHPLPMRRMLIVLGVMAIGIAGLWMLIEQFSNVDVNDPTPAPTIPSPVDDPQLPGTPDIDGEAAPRAGSLPDLLRYAPDRLADGSLPLTDVGRYADIQAWMASRGLDAPASLTDPGLAGWNAELAALALPTSLADRGLEPEWERPYGFNLTQVDQALIVGQAPDYVMILRGGFDATALQNAWVRSGYQAVEVEGTTIWTLFPGDTIDLSDTASRPAMGMLNNIVLLEDGTLVAAAKLPRLQSALRAVNGSAPSLADNASIASLFGPATNSGNLVSAVISKGSLLESLPGDLPAPGRERWAPQTSPVASLPAIANMAILDVQMPAVDLVMVGILMPVARDAGATPAVLPGVRLQMVLSFENIDDARIARRVIEGRLAAYLSPVTGAAYRQRHEGAQSRVLDADGDPAIVEITATLAHGAGDWLAILRDRDMGYAFWIGEDPFRDE